ncbi:MAG: DUF4925 domain-containing protein [Prevotella sp.]|jgi:hypothetical protein|nr:DUF4925 domain-containing protein [Prevotella sp.]
MKTKLFYLVGVVFLLWSTGTFTSCINGVDDEYLELVNSGSGGRDTVGEDGLKLPDLNGNYEQGGDFELKMIYNGEELSGKRVNVAADELNETATITLSGVDKDLSEMLGGLLEFKFETFSPVPGIKEIVLPNVTLYNSKGIDYRFTGGLIEPTYTLNYEGTIKDGKMEISINHQLANQKLAGTWDLAPNSTTGSTWLFSPLCLDWDSRVQVNLGKVSIVTIKGEMNGIFSLLTGVLSSYIMKSIIGVNIKTMDLIRNMLKGMTAQPDGCMFATYSYSGDVLHPEWSSNMPRNAIRYYYDPENPDKKLYMEVNPDFLIGLISGLTNPTLKSRAAADPEVTKELGRQLIALLTPVLQKGIPCDYVLEGNNLTVNIDGVVLRDILRKLFELANDEVARPVVEELINNSLGDLGSNIMNLIRLVPYTLKYHDATTYDPVTNVPLDATGECAYVKFGLKFVKVN